MPSNETADSVALMPAGPKANASGASGRGKRQTRPRIVELNGPAERVELLLLIFMAPLWGLVFPLVGLSMLLSFPGLIMIGASLFCCLHFLHLNNNNFTFEEKGIRLPGVDHKLRPYQSVKSIYIETLNPLLLAVELPGSGASARAGAKVAARNVTQLFEAQHLTEESARQLWGLCATYLRHSAIALDVRNRLVNWRTQAGASNYDYLQSQVQAPTKNQIQSESALQKLSGNNESQIGRDLSLLVELKPFNPIKLVAQYMASYSETFRKTWLTFWIVIAGFTYPITIFNWSMEKLSTQNQTSTAVPYYGSNPAQARLSDHVSSGITQLQQNSGQAMVDFFGNYWGAIGLLVLVTVLIYKLIQHTNEPDSIFIDYLGITTQKRTPAGVMPKEHRSWKTLKAIHLLRPHEKSNSSRWTILFESHDGKATVEVPFKAFSSDRIREQMLECIDVWGRNLIVDNKLLEALAPLNQTSYTELWMSALAEAPKIDELTPHSVGLRLESKDYEIVRQLASGGQGVTYLAKKTNADEERVVLKETVLPIYVDERARVKAVDKFNRDAKLLASLDHDMIVHLEEYFVENNRAYLALEYVPGVTLKEKVENDGPLDEAEVRRLALLMAEILAYLHGRTPPVVHRDFTPDNLILNTDGRLKLIDFDVATEQNNFSQANATIVGKQSYIPLEQFRGKPCPQSDIYALGATLAFLLTGEEPSAIQASHPRLTRPDISEDMDNIIAQATESDLQQRTADAVTLRQQLQNDGKHLDASQVEPIEPVEPIEQTVES